MVEEVDDAGRLRCVVVAVAVDCCDSTLTCDCESVSEFVCESDCDIDIIDD